MHTWQKDVVDFNGHSDVHGRGVGVVGALRFVHVVVWVDWIFGPELTTKDFDSLGQTEPTLLDNISEIEKSASTFRGTRKTASGFQVLPCWR